ncbi:MAG: hypothetical protein H8E46_03930 [FCB group bacterium]|nr:hypothetical protein [FCB group bacterium]
MRYTSVFLLALSLLLFSCQSDNSDLPTTPQPAQTDALSPENQGELVLVRPVDPGPPASITIGELGDAEEALENPWGAQIMAVINIRVRDAQGFFVEELTPVFIEIDAPDVHTEPTVLTGEYGIAPVEIYYSSPNTFDFFDLTVRCNSGTGTIEITAENLQLPIYGGEITISVVPSSWMFFGQDVCVQQVTATLRDGFDFLISNGLVNFANSVGMFFCTDSVEAAGELQNGWLNNGNWVFEQLTDENGQTVLFMRAEEETNTSVTPNYPGVFIDPITPEVICEVHSFLEANIFSDPWNVTYRRNP